jgi:hypothetical protein
MRLFGVLAILVATLATSTRAQEIHYADRYIWKKDNVTGNDIALSRSDPSLNFVDVGDLSNNSINLVQGALGSIAGAAGKTVDRNLEKVAIIIIHDTNVFTRLKADRGAFSVMGVPDFFIYELQKRYAEAPDMTCINISTDDKDSNVVFTTILVSKKFDSCLIGGLFQAYGVETLDINSKSLDDVCILYEGRKLGLRDRESLTQQMPKLRDLCTTKSGDAKWLF